METVKENYKTEEITRIEGAYIELLKIGYSSPIRRELWFKKVSGNLRNILANYYCKSNEEIFATFQELANRLKQ